MGSPTSLFEHSFYIGSYLSGILYGIELMMYFSTLRELRRRARTRQSWKFYCIYSTLLFVLVTIDMATNAVWGEIMWIDKREDPGVLTFIMEDLSVWYQIMGSTTVVIMVLMGDALLLYRLFIIWGSNYWVVLLPGLVYCATLALGILELVSAFKPGGWFFSGKAVNFGTPYYSITVSMNVIITSLICGRLFYLSRQVRQALGKENAKLYTSIAAMLIESAAPYTAMGILFLPFYAKGNNVVVALGQVWSKLTCIAPQMIILRVVSGKAWSRDTLTQRPSATRYGPPTKSDRGAEFTTAMEFSSGHETTVGTTLDGSPSTIRKQDSRRSTTSVEKLA
ncbi:hypothetical protein BXZ70DRAFT_689954 [Cristinia sonorae]|uniref:Uncharacterized protein n=1 Tax=Cristinia sonorae TaxID=1940300 RepID=A0A8K0UEI3_9AGAR|nr:hypothetical protein BXZ70DRAFT_689954 [Cristinia sonorae]